LKEILTAKSKKSKKEEKKGPKNKNLFDFFDFAVNPFFKVRCFSGNIDVEKVNADTLVFTVPQLVHIQVVLLLLLQNVVGYHHRDRLQPKNAWLKRPD
jgi:hypothetical protein